MIRRLLAALLLVLAAAPVALAAPAPDWTRTAVRTADGGIRVGNPRAAVALVEIANYTCPHCAHFSAAAAATLADRIRRGALSVEYRPIVNNALGLAATVTVTARCVPARFLAVNDALYAAQDRLFTQANAYLDANRAALTAAPPLRQVALIARGSGIVALAAGAGAPAAQVNACLARQTALDDAVRAGAQAGALVTATPTFLIGAERVEGADWPGVQAKLRAAGLK